MRDDHLNSSQLELGSVLFRTRLRRTWTVPVPRGTAMSLTVVSRGDGPGMGRGIRVEGEAHLTSSETQLQLIHTVGLENYAARHMPPAPRPPTSLPIAIQPL